MIRIADKEMAALAGGIFALLGLASLVRVLLAPRLRSAGKLDTLANLKSRIRAWWVMCAVMLAALWCGDGGAVILFALVSLLAMREYLALTPARGSDRRALLWSLLVILPLQYYFVAARWYGMFAIFIPVYGFLFLALRIALTGETEKFLERAALLQWGLMAFVYFVSHAPALLMLNIPGYAGQNAKLLLFLLLVVELSDVFQYVFGKTLGRHKIAPRLSPNKTWEGFLGGTAAATLCGVALWWATPFRPWQAALAAWVAVIMGFAGGLCMSAVKRDRGVKDFGTLLEGHGGVIDRIDSLCFAAPVFFHVVRFFFY